MTDRDVSSTSEVLTLRSLSPKYDPSQHADYVEIVTAELVKTGPDAPRNIALTGHYGSGKSSVLLEVHRQIEEKNGDLKAINLSLPSLGIGDGRIPVNGEPALDKTNLIQKEIVKQLLYRRSPSAMPASRYNRLDTFDERVARWRGVYFGLVVTAIALLAGVPSEVRTAFPPELWIWVNDHLWGSLARSFQYLSLLVVFGFAGIASVWVQRLLQQRIRVTELAAGPTKVTLSQDASSYFDEYLDEIVYFFQVSETTVVIFEDLDRFEDPHIFETLRELNLLLNNADQTGTRPIRFVYAIRDSIFEKLDVSVDSPNNPDRVQTSGDEQGPQRDDLETRRLMSTNRTKFFDLVVPIVPFISHRTSRDLIRGELKSIEEKQRPTGRVVDLVSVHLTDMRLIKNICNEYDVFQRRILTDEGLKELTADRLFASIVYKNVYLVDYENIRNGSSTLDKLYSAYRSWVMYQTASAREAERKAQGRIRRLDAVGARSVRLGNRFEAVLPAVNPAMTRSTIHNFTVGAEVHGWDDLLTAAFWSPLIADSLATTVAYKAPNSYGGLSTWTIDFDQMQTLLGMKLSATDWSEQDRAELLDEVEAAVTDHREAAQSSMAEALAQSDKQFLHDGKTQSVSDVAGQLFEGAGLALELLSSGFIDENFALYVTQFPGQSISASAMNFIIKSVQPNVMDIDYQFGPDSRVGISPIDAVLDAEGTRLLGGESVFNIEIFDHILALDPTKLAEPIGRLAASAGNEQDFIDAYLASGKQTPRFVQMLSARWQGIFDYLIGQDPEAASLEAVDAALSGASPDLDYMLNEVQRDVISLALPTFETVTNTQTPNRAEDLARVLRRMSMRVSDLSVVPAPLRGQLVSRCLFTMSLANLRTVAGSDDLLPLDQIKAHISRDVYQYVLTNAREYLSALDGSLNIPTVSARDQFADTLAHIGAINIDLVEDVARRANDECMIEELGDLSAALWPKVALAYRLALTADNVSAYFAEHGVDGPISEWLAEAGAIEVENASVPLGPLAVQILNTGALENGTKMKLVHSLGLEIGTVSASDLAATAHPSLPALVRDGLVKDDDEAFTALAEDDWATKGELVAVSTQFPSYMTTLSLNATDLLWLASGQSRDKVNDVLLEQIHTFDAHLGPKGAAALASWAAINGRRVSPDALVILATKGAGAGSKPIVKLLGAQTSSIDIATMKIVLEALGKPYSQLTVPGRDRPKVPSGDGIEPILARLNADGIVSKYELKAKGTAYQVSKRHS